MHKKLGFLVMLVGFLALSLAFVGCGGDAGIGDGDPAPYYLQGTWEPSNTAENAILIITPLTATYGTAPYRISVSVTETDFPDVVGKIEFTTFTGDEAGSISFEGTIGGGALSVTFDITASSHIPPYFVPVIDDTYTKTKK